MDTVHSVTSEVVRADPATGSATLLSSSIEETGRDTLLPAAPPAAATGLTGYQIGERITVARLGDGILSEDLSFALPSDPLSGFCMDGGLPVGAGLDTPVPATTVRVFLAVMTCTLYFTLGAMLCQHVLVSIDALNSHL